MTLLPAAARRRGTAPRRRAGAAAEPVGSNPAWRLLRKLTAVAIGLLFLVPFYITVVTSLGPQDQQNIYPRDLLPRWDWANYSFAWSQQPWARLMLNTLLIASCTVLLCLVTSALAGFAFGVLRFPGKRALTVTVAAVLMMPTIVLIVPDYVLAYDIHLVNTYWIQIIPFGASVFGIFLVRQFLVTMPQELLDAASLDGAGRVRVLWHICLPLVRPALVIIAINAFMASWNAFLWPDVMTVGNPSVQPIEVGLFTFIGEQGTNYPALAAACTFTSLPVLVFFLVLQRQFIRGALSAAGGLRG